MKTIIFIIATTMFALSIINYSYDLELSIAYFAAAIAFYLLSWSVSIIKCKKYEIEYYKSRIEEEEKCYETLSKLYDVIFNKLQQLKTNSAKWEAAFEKERERQRLKSKRQYELKKAIKQSEF